MDGEQRRATAVAFLLALWREWVLLMGGTVSVIMAVVSTAANRPIPAWVFWAIAVGCLLVACYKAWAAERNETVRLAEFAAERERATAAEAALLRETIERNERLAAIESQRHHEAMSERAQAAREEAARFNDMMAERERAAQAEAERFRQTLADRSDEREAARRQKLLDRLREMCYVDGAFEVYCPDSEKLTIAPLPKAWVEKQLEKMGEAWRQDVYR